MVFNGSQPLAKNPRSGLGQSDFFILHPELLKKGWSLPGKSFNFGRLASTSGLSSSSASAPAWYLFYSVSTHGLPNEIYFSVFISVLQAQFKSVINIDDFLLFRFFDNCPD